MTTIETGFKYLEFDKNTEFEEDTTSKNYLLFFLKAGQTLTKSSLEEGQEEG